MGERSGGVGWGLSEREMEGLRENSKAHIIHTAIAISLPDSAGPLV
jgi:hypothetical protein